MQSLFKEKKYYSHQKDNDVSKRLFQSGICLPSGSNMIDEDQQRVIQAYYKAIEYEKWKVSKSGMRFVYVPLSVHYNEF